MLRAAATIALATTYYSTVFALLLQRQSRAVLIIGTHTSRNTRRAARQFFGTGFENHHSQQQQQQQQHPWKHPAIMSSQEEEEEEPLLSQQHDPPSSSSLLLPWTVCGTCHGEGRFLRRQRLSRKARFKRSKNNKQQDLPIPTTICKKCQGSGLVVLVQSNKNETLATPSFDATNDDDDDVSRRRRQQLHVAVVGGGIAGLAFAAACAHRSIATTVYERDAHFYDRHQGYGLTLQQAAPQLAALGIPSLDTAAAGGITSTKHIVHAPDGTVKGQWGMRHWLGKNNNSSNEEEPTAAPTNGQQPSAKRKNKKRQNVHIARQALRYELYKAATASSSSSAASSDKSSSSSDNDIVKIQWNHRLVSFQEHADFVDLTLVHNGTTVVHRRAHLLVGADGIRSQVRQQLIPDTPLRYLGCIVILGICPLSNGSIKLQDDSFVQLLDGETVFQTADGTTRIYMMPYSATEYMWQLSFPMTEQDAQALSADGASRLLQAATQRCGEWHSPIPEILTATPLPLVSGYPVYDRAILTSDVLLPSSRRRVTLLGDAAHPMSPFKGQGANQALLDALSLARALYRTTLLSSSSSKNSTSTSSADGNDTMILLHAVQDYEREMLKRSAVKVQASAEASRFLHTNVAIHEGNVTRGAAAAAVAAATARNSSSDT